MFFLLLSINKAYFLLLLIAFYHVNGSCRAILANRGEISHENMVAQGEFFA